MLYYLYEWNHAALTPMRAAADATRLLYQNPLNPFANTGFGRAIAASAELFERTTRVYGKPEFGLTETVADGIRVPVRETVVMDEPFCRLLRFERDVPKSHRTDPRFLIVAPLSGHYATLLRGTVEALLPYADVHITDWKDAKTVPLAAGSFNLDDYTQYVIDFLRKLGKDTHVLAVCQPAVPVMMAVAAMEKAGDEFAPATMTVMGGPIDTRVNPTAVNRLAQEKGIDWFRDNVIMSVPFPQPGFMRKVYPGFLQLTGFMSMNLDRHMSAHKEFFWHLIKDDGDSADKHRVFYDEYNAVMDMTAEFYLQTVEEVFIKHSLPKGEMMFKGERIDLTAIKRVGLLTIEGENDDISGVGQTEAAQDLCINIPDDMRVHYVQPKVGHYGVFNGSRFRAEIVPRIIDFALTHGKSHSDARLPKGANATQTPRKIGAHAERRAKAAELGQTLHGGETGLAEPLLGMTNPFAASERLLRVLTEPAEKALQRGLAVAQGSYGSTGVGSVSAEMIRVEPRARAVPQASPEAVTVPEPAETPTPKTADASAETDLSADAKTEGSAPIVDQPDVTATSADAAAPELIETPPVTQPEPDAVAEDASGAPKTMAEAHIADAVSVLAEADDPAIAGLAQTDSTVGDGVLEINDLETNDDGTASMKAWAASDHLREDIGAQNIADAEPAKGDTVKADAPKAPPRKTARPAAAKAKNSEPVGKPSSAVPAPVLASPVLPAAETIVPPPLPGLAQPGQPQAGDEGDVLIAEKQTSPAKTAGGKAAANRHARRAATKAKKN